MNPSHTLLASVFMSPGGGLGAAAVVTAQAALAAAQPALQALITARSHPSWTATAASRRPFSCSSSSSSFNEPASSSAGLQCAPRSSRLLQHLVGGSAGTRPAVTAASRAWGHHSAAASYHSIHMSASTAAESPLDTVQAVMRAVQQQNKDPAVLASLARTAGAHATSGQLSPLQIRDLCVSFAELGYFDVGFKSAIAEAIIPKMSTFEPTVLADTMHAYGLAQYYDFELMSEAVNYLKSNADRFDATALAKMLWSFGRCGFQDEALMEIMHSVAEKLAASCDSTSLADVVYAEAQMGWADQRLAELVADYAADNIETFDGSSLTRLLAGLASVGYDDDDLAEAAGRHACNLLESGAMSPSQLVPLMWAYGLQGHYHKGLMAHAEALLEDEDIVDSLTSDELHTLIDAFNNLGMHGPGISSAAARLGRLMPTIEDREADTRERDTV